MKDILTTPEPRFAVLLGRVTNPAGEDHGVTVEYDWHHNHRMYRTAPTARSCVQGGNLFPFDTEEVRVIKIDPAIVEPEGMSAQQEYEFCERMTDYWANRTVEAMAKAQAGGTPPKAKRRARSG